MWSTDCAARGAGDATWKEDDRAKAAKGVDSPPAPGSGDGGEANERELERRTNDAGESTEPRTELRLLLMETGKDDYPLRGCRLMDSLYEERIPSAHICFPKKIRAPRRVALYSNGTTAHRFLHGRKIAV